MSDIKSPTKVTQIFQSIVTALYRDQNDVNGGEPRNNESTDDIRLSEETFDVLIKSGEGYPFKKQEIMKKVGKNAYKQYIKVGVLVEETAFCEPTHRNGRLHASTQDLQTEVRFYHVIFLEWYATKKLLKIAESSSIEELEEVLNKIKPLHHQYIYRFTCGLSERAAVNIVQCLEKKEDYKKFSQVCTAEQEGGVGKILSVVENLCSLPVTITKDDPMVHQRSVVQLLEIASKEQIIIEVLWLQVPGVSFNRTQGVIEFGSGIQLPKLNTLQQLSIVHSAKLPEYELQGLLMYASMCKQLMCFRLRGYLLPQKVSADVMKEMNKANFTVEWILPVSNKPRYVLNRRTGYWEDSITKTKMSDSDYQRAKEALGFHEDENKNVLIQGSGRRHST